MDSRKNKIYKILAIFMLSTYLRSIKATNIDCGEKPFHCINSTHFMICVDLGGGISTTVDDFVIQCPPPTTCHPNNRFECEYQLPTTTLSNIHQGYETNGFTIDPRANTILSNDNSNTITSDQKISVTEIINEYNTIDVTTQADYALEKQIETQIKDTFTNTNTNISTIEDISLLSTGTTESSAEVTLLSNFSDMISHNSNNTMKLMILPIISKRPFTANINNMTNITNVLNGTALNNDFSFVKSEDILHDNTTKTANISIFPTADQEVNIIEFLNKTNYINVITSEIAQPENNDTKFDITQITSPILHPRLIDKSNVENTLLNIQNIKSETNQAGEIMKKILVTEAPPSSKTTQVKKLITPKKTMPQIHFQNERENFNYDVALPKIKNISELSSHLNLIGRASLKDDVGIYSRYDPNILNRTENDKLSTGSSTSDSTIMPMEYVTDKQKTNDIITTTSSSYNLNDSELVLFEDENKTIIFPETELTSTVKYSITVQYEAPDFLTPNPGIDKIIMSPTFENLRTVTNVTEEKIPEVIKNTFTKSSRSNNITVSSTDGQIEITSTMVPKNSILDHNSSSIEYQTRKPELNLLGQTEKYYFDETLLGTYNTIESPSELNFIQEITEKEGTSSVYDANILDTTEKNNFATLFFTSDSTMIPLKYDTDTQETIITTTPSSNNFNDSELLLFEDDNNTLRFPEMELTSTVKNSIILQNKASDVLPTKSGIDEIVISSMFEDKIISKNLTAETKVNVTGKNVEEMVTDSLLMSSRSSGIITLSSTNEQIEVTSTVRTDNFVIDDIPTSIKYQTIKPELNLLKQTLSNTAITTELPTELNLIRSTTSKEEEILSSYDVHISDTDEKNNIGTVSSTLTSPMVPTEYVVDTKQKTISTPSFVYNLNESELLLFENENKTPIFTEAQLTSTIVNSVTSQYELSKITTKPELNTVSQSINTLETESSVTFPYRIEDYTLLPQKQNIRKNTRIPIKPIVNPYIYGTFLSGDIVKSTSELNLEEKTHSNNILSTSLPYTSRTSFSINTPTTNTDTSNIFTDTEFTTSYLLSANQQTTIPQAADKKELLKNTTESDNDLSKNKVNSTFFNSTLFISDAKTSTVKGTTLIYDYDTLPDVQGTVEINKTERFINNKNFVNNKNYDGLMSKDGKDKIINTPIFYDPVSPDREEITPIKSDLMTDATSKSISEFKVIQDGFLNEYELLINHVNSNTESFLQDEGYISNWRDSSYSTTENSILPKSTLEVSYVVNFAQDGVSQNEIPEKLIKTFSNNNNDQILSTKSWVESISDTITQKSVDTNNEEIYFVDEITTAPGSDGMSTNKYANEVILKNKQAVTDILTLLSHDQIITEKSTGGGYYLPNMEVMLTNEMIISSTRKPLRTDETPSTISTGEILNTYINIPSEENLKGMAVNSEVNTDKNFISEPKNENLITVKQKMPHNINESFTTNILAPEPVDKIINFGIQKENSINNTTVINTTNTYLLESNSFNVSSENPLNTSESVQYVEILVTVRSLLEQDQNLTQFPNNTNSTISKYIVTKKETPVNITHNFVDKQSNELSVKYPVNHKNDSLKSIYPKNHEIGANAPTTIANIIFSRIAEKNNTPNNVGLKNNENQLNITNEDRTSNKRSVLGDTKISLYNALFKNAKTDTVNPGEYANEVKVVDTVKEALQFTTPHGISEILSKTDEIENVSQIIIKGKKDSYVDKNGIYNILYEHSTMTTISDTETIKDTNIEKPNQGGNILKTERPITKIIFNKTSQSDIPKTPVTQQGSITTVHSPIPVLTAEQVSNYTKLNQSLITKNDSNDKFAYIDNIRKVESVPTLSRVTSFSNDKILATRTKVKSESRNNTNRSMSAVKSSVSTSLFTCGNWYRGRFADKNNCSKYYICIGKLHPIVGMCPINTVFSEIKKQCTKNLSHCIRNNQFRCMQEGRFSDVLRSNIYYICVNNNNKNSYVRFQFQCQNGYNLNKTSVRCVNDIKNKSEKTSTSLDSNNSNKGSDQSTVEHKTKEIKQVKEDEQYICKQEGKFPDATDCRRYYVCSKKSKSVFRRRTKKCDSDEVFHREKGKCVDRDSYECSC